MAGARSLGSLTLDLIAKIGGFTAPLDAAGRKLDRNLSAMEKRAKAFGVALGAGLAAAATASAYAIKASIDRMDELSKGAQKIGVTTEALSRLSYAADLSDVSLEQLQGGLAKMTKYQAEAAQGGKEAVQTFEAFGIAVQDNAGNLRGTEAVLQDFARVFAALPDGPEKTALALRVFGKAGAELIPLLNSGASGLRDMADEADRLGITIDSVAGKQAEEFNDDLTRLQAQVKGLANDVAQKLLPELVNLAEAFRAAGEDGGDSFADLIANELAGVSKAIRGTVIEIDFLKKAWKEQGVLGEGVLSVLDRANTEIQRREALAGGLDIHRGPLGRGSARKGAEQGKADAEARQVEEQARKLLATTQASTGATRAHSDAQREAREAEKRRADALEELQKQVQETAEAQEQFATRLEDLNAAGDPLAEAALQYKRELEDVRALAEKGEVSTSKRAEAEKRLGEQYARTTDEIRDRLDTGGQQLEQMQQELDLLNMQSRAERVRAQFLIDNPTASQSQADAAARMDAQIEQTREQIGAMDQLRDSASDTFQSIMDGSEGGIDALKDFGNAFAQMLEKMASDWLSSALFGERGTTGGGLFGNLASSLFGGLLGGGSSSSSSASNFGIPLLGQFVPGFAAGTDYAPGGWADVGERGRERVYLPRGAQVVPHHELEAAGAETSFTQVNNFTLPRRFDNRSQMQVAQAGERMGRVATRRNGG